MVRVVAEALLISMIESRSVRADNVYEAVLASIVVIEGTPTLVWVPSENATPELAVITLANVGLVTTET
jgi:hypothetical protein